MSAAWVQKRVRARNERKRECGVAAMINLDAAVAAAVHALLAVHGEIGEGERDRKSVV